MELPTTVSALMELFHGANWMQTAIPRFSELIEPLNNLLESQYSVHKTRLKSKIRARPLSAWGDEHKAAFISLFRRSLIKSLWQLLTLRSAYAFSRMRLITLVPRDYVLRTKLRLFYEFLEN